MKKLKIIWLRETFPWMGRYSGYDQVCKIIALSEQIICSSVKMRSVYSHAFCTFFLKNHLEKVRLSETYGFSGMIAEYKILWKVWLKRKDIVHVHFIEDALGILPRWKKTFSYKIIATAHQPSRLWKIGRHDIKLLDSVDGLIVLSKKEKEYFEQYIPGKVHFIPHGIDIDFFCPDLLKKDIKKEFRCVFSGVWLRDVITLEKVIKKTLSTTSKVIFDIIVPTHRRNHPSFINIAAHDQVHWHARLSDVELREVYRNANLLLLPLIDSTANNALLEAMACGLPVLSNDIGGVLDYTDPSFAELVPIEDIDGFVHTILHYAENPELCREKGILARKFAEKNFSYKTIGGMTLNVYKKVSED